ncbi:hypothetical protein AVEN_185874-1, partial [Araneus ventricosus]
EELLIDSLSGLGLIEVWTEIRFNVGADGILIPLTETSFYTISNGGSAAAAVTGSVTIGNGLADGIVNQLSKNALNPAVNQGSVLATNILEKTKSLNFWANIDSRTPLHSPHLLKDVIHETLQEIYPKTKLECFRSNKRRIKNLEKKRRPTSTKAKSPYFYEYAFHHDGVVMAKFQNRGQPPELLHKHSDFENARTHFEIKFHPYINNQLRKLQADNLMQRFMDREIGRPVSSQSVLLETGHSISTSISEYWESGGSPLRNPPLFENTDDSIIRSKRIDASVDDSVKKQNVDSDTMEDDNIPDPDA